MPTLNWIGKEAVVNHHHDVPYRTLDKQYTFNNGETIVGGGRDAINRVSTENKIIHGDNLEALKALLPEYEGRIKCIYIDPPYNTGNENWVYNDNVNSPKIQKWLGQVVGKEAEDLSRHDKWLCMMYPRLKLLHQLLANDGAIFISIDDNEQANLKLICDEIFGKSNFIAQFIWQKKTGASDAKNIAIVTEYILFYAGSSTLLNVKKNTESYDLKRYRHKDEFVEQRGPFYIDNLDRGGLQYSDSLNYGISCPDGTITFPNGRTEFYNDGWIWKWSKSKLDWAIENKFVEFRKSESKRSGWAVCYKNYLKVDNENNPVNRAAPYKNLILDILNADAASAIKDIFSSNIFPYSKPVELISNFINLISDKSSIILDSFAGSGTTAHAVLNLNKQDGGNRKFILVEMEDYAENITAERVRRVINGYGEGKNAVEGTGGSFSYYELGEPIFTDDQNLNESVGVEKMREYIWYSETRVPYCRNGVHTVSTGNAQSYLLGNHDGTDYYFYYEPDRITTLSHDTLNIVERKADTYVVYADQCVIDKEWLNNHHIIFKKIPRDIRRF